MKRKSLLFLLTVAVSTGVPLRTMAAPTVRDITPTDVTPRAFSVVWAASEAVTGATLTFFSDASGANDITSTLPPALFVSPATAASKGVVKVTVAELPSQSTICFQTRTTGTSGTTLAPPTPPYPCITTESTARIDTDAGAPIVNDLLRFEALAADQTTPLNGGLLVVNAKDVSTYPISAFVGEGCPLPTAVTNLRNLFDGAVHETADLAGNDILEVRKFRGLADAACTLEEHVLFHFRRAPAHAETPAMSELEAPAVCFFADTVCDDRVDILDVQRVLNLFNKNCGVCQFNADLDIVDDCTINILDVQSVLNRFGQSAPFPQ
jgi:hypothetical protein